MAMPELEGLSPAEVRRLSAEAQRAVLRRPPMLLGLFATLMVAALIGVAVFGDSGFLAWMLIGASIGGGAGLFLHFVATPKMREYLRQQGYPRRQV